MRGFSYCGMLTFQIRIYDLIKHSKLNNDNPLVTSNPYCQLANRYDIRKRMTLTIQICPKLQIKQKQIKMGITFKIFFPLVSSGLQITSIVKALINTNFRTATLEAKGLGHGCTIREGRTRASAAQLTPAHTRGQACGCSSILLYPKYFIIKQEIHLKFLFFLNHKLYDKL